MQAELHCKTQNRDSQQRKVIVSTHIALSELDDVFDLDNYLSGFQLALVFSSTSSFFCIHSCVCNLYQVAQDHGGVCLGITHGCLILACMSEYGPITNGPRSWGGVLTEIERKLLCILTEYAN